MDKKIIVNSIVEIKGMQGNWKLETEETCLKTLEDHEDGDHKLHHRIMTPKLFR